MSDPARPWTEHGDGWRSWQGGRRWRLTPDGVETRNPSGPPWRPRTGGEPVSVAVLMADYGDAFVAAARAFGIGVDVLVALACVEAAVLDDGIGRDPRSVRRETGYESDERTPNRVSYGLMQPLLSTARGVAHEIGLAKADLGPEELYDPQVSLMVAAAYLRSRWNRHGGDPVLMQAAYNAGGVYPGDTPFGLRTYSPGRTDKFLAFLNDFYAAMAEGRVAVPYGRLLSTPPEPVEDRADTEEIRVAMAGLSP